MTVSLVELPVVAKEFTMTIPFERKGPVWHALSPGAKIVEQYMAAVHKQRFLYATALTSKLQIEEIMELHYGQD
jgi:hypothetical protein